VGGLASDFLAMEAPCARRLDHQHRKTFRFPPSVEEALIDAVREPGEKLDSAGQPTRRKELMGPATVREVPRLVGAVLDREDPWDVPSR
jgi:hypothetical protein